MDFIIIHTNMLFHIVMHTLSLQCMHVARLAEVGQGPLNYHFTLVTQLTVTALRFPVLATRLASRDHLMCMMNLACILASWGEGPESGWLVMVVKTVWLQSEALFRIRRQS